MLQLRDVSMALSSRTAPMVTNNDIVSMATDNRNSPAMATDKRNSVAMAIDERNSLARTTGLDCNKITMVAQQQIIPMVTEQSVVTMDTNESGLAKLGFSFYLNSLTTSVNVAAMLQLYFKLHFFKTLHLKISAYTLAALLTSD